MGMMSLKRTTYVTTRYDVYGGFYVEVTKNPEKDYVVGDGYQYGNWMYTWKPKDGISRYIPDPNVGKVFVVCHDDTYPKHVDKTKTIMRVAKFLNEYAENF